MSIISLLRNDCKFKYAEIRISGYYQDWNLNIWDMYWMCNQYSTRKDGGEDQICIWGNDRHTYQSQKNSELILYTLLLEKMRMGVIRFI